MRAGSRNCRVVAAAVGIVALVAGVGCGSGVDPAAEADRAGSIATTRGGAGGDELILPVNTYSFTVPERNRLGWARQVLIGACMRKLGYHHDDAADAAQHKRVTAIDLADHGVYGNKRRYVLTDMTTAGKYGYHLVSTANGVRGAEDRHDPHRPGARSTAEQQALTGVDSRGRRVTRTSGGRPVPAGGCIGATDATLSHTGSVGEAGPVSRLDGASYARSLHDGRVRAAFAAWSRCMAGSGYRITSPLHASDKFDLGTSTVSAAEIATARADVACKRHTHLTDIWFGCEMAYQKTQIRRHADEFHQAKLDHDAVMEAVTATLAGQP